MFWAVSGVISLDKAVILLWLVLLRLNLQQHIQFWLPGTAFLQSCGEIEATYREMWRN